MFRPAIGFIPIMISSYFLYFVISWWVSKSFPCLSDYELSGYEVESIDNPFKSWFLCFSYTSSNGEVGSMKDLFLIIFILSSVIFVQLTFPTVNWSVFHCTSFSALLFYEFLADSHHVKAWFDTPLGYCFDLFLCLVDI